MKLRVISLCTLLPAWEMMEGETVEIFAPPFKYPTAQGSAHGSLEINLHYKTKSSPCATAFKIFDALIQHQVQA
ncbi:hypothetical protein, partial [Pedobacter sp. AJM]|uniref:hypothetical protein n=1 Tax=Pedobacter sp. AJM TaxID=2003629 RepID=UPI001C0F2BD9